MNKNKITVDHLYVILIIACFIPLVSPVLSLSMGMFLSLLGMKSQKINKYSSLILKLSIILLGFKMNLDEVIKASLNGFFATMISVFLVMFCGIILGKLLKVEKNIALLIATGTAICGGSAIAAVAPIIKSKDYQNSFALIVVFVLNALAIFLFPLIGNILALSQETFGNWAAIAIHDTSSVVGASALYGEQALSIATTVKLIRALWIIPLSFVIAYFQKDNKSGKIQVPWFIFIFILAIFFAWFFPAWRTSYVYLSWLGKRGMVIALLLIGSNISIDKIKQSGFKSFTLGVLLWAATAIISLLVLTA